MSKGSPLVVSAPPPVKEATIVEEGAPEAAEVQRRETERLRRLAKSNKPLADKLDEMSETRRGIRPPKTMQQVCVWLPVEQHAKLLSLARNKRLSMGDIIVAALAPVLVENE